MAEPIEHKVARSLEAAEGLYHRLVLVVGKSGSGKTAVLQNLAKPHNDNPLNINRLLSNELLELTEKQRLLKLADILNRIVGESAEIALLDNTEILFDTELKQDPLRLLQGLSRNHMLVASWNGSFMKGKLTYAEPGHDEYRSYDLADTLVVTMDGEATVDFKYSSEEKLL